MHAPLFVHPPTEWERQALAAGLRSADALRRSQIVLASARGERVPPIARSLGCGEQTVRNALHAFDAQGAAALTAGSSRPQTIHPAFDAAGAERRRALLHRSPREFGHPTSVWTLEAAADVAYAEGLTAPRVADWVVGFADETWWSRVARPAVHAWTDGARLRLVEPTVARADPDPKALAGSGLLLRQPAARDALWLRFVEGRPLSALTEQFLNWTCDQLAAAGTTTLVLVWDNAAWHVSRAIRTWLRAHNQQAHREGGVRVIPSFLPNKSPWLNPIEPKWIHGKRRILEPARLLTASEVEDRVCAALGCSPADHLCIPQEVA